MVKVPRSINKYLWQNDNSITNLSFHWCVRISNDSTCYKVRFSIRLKIHEIFVDLLSIESVNNLLFTSKLLLLCFRLFVRVIFNSSLFCSSLWSLFFSSSWVHDKNKIMITIYLQAFIILFTLKNIKSSTQY